MPLRRLSWEKMRSTTKSHETPGRPEVIRVGKRSLILPCRIEFTSPFKISNLLILDSYPRPINTSDSGIGMQVVLIRSFNLLLARQFRENMPRSSCRDVFVGRGRMIQFIDAVYWLKEGFAGAASAECGVYIQEASVKIVLCFGTRGFLRATQRAKHRHCN
jgi:hypothetical protein